MPDTQLPAVTGARLVKALQAAGFVLTRTRGSHHRLKHADGRATTVPVHAGTDVPKGTLRGVLRDCGMSAEDLRQLLRLCARAARCASSSLSAIGVSDDVGHTASRQYRHVKMYSQFHPVPLATRAPFASW